MTHHYPKLNRGQLVVVVTCLLLAVLFFSRHWIRGSVLPWYASQLTAEQIDAAAKHTFTDANVILLQAGLQLNPPTDKVRTCNQVLNSYLNITVICYKEKSVDDWANSHPVPQTFINEWPMIVQSLTQNKSAMPWSIDRSYYNASPSDLFKGPLHNNVAFIRYVGKVKCELDVDVQPAQEGYLSSYGINEACSRDVKFFSGY